jgi:hypothetical protein
VNDHVSPGGSTGDVNAPPSATTRRLTESLLVHVTVSLAPTVTSAGAKPELVIETAVAAVAGAAVARASGTSAKSNSFLIRKPPVCLVFLVPGREAP